MTEEWRDVLGWEGLYKVSSQGRVKSLAGFFLANRKGKLASIPKPERILKNTLTAGYPSVSLCREGRCTTTYVHRLVCEAWHGPSNGRDAAHRDGSRTKNHPANLRWATRQENMADKSLHGTQLRGDDLWFTKVPDADIPIIRKSPPGSSKTLADRYNVSVSLVDAIKRGTRRVYEMERYNVTG